MAQALEMQMPHICQRQGRLSPPPPNPEALQEHGALALGN